MAAYTLAEGALALRHVNARAGRRAGFDLAGPIL